MTSRRIHNNNKIQSDCTYKPILVDKTGASTPVTFATSVSISFARDVIVSIIVIASILTVIVIPVLWAQQIGPFATHSSSHLSQ